MLGESTTDGEGKFKIIFRPTRSVWKELQFLSAVPGAAFHVKVFSDKNDLLYIAEPTMSINGLDMSLAVPVPGIAIPDQIWEMIAEQMQLSPGIKINEVVRELIAVNPAESVISNLDLVTRHALVMQMEQDFLDPSGILRNTAGPLPGFQSLREPASLSDLSERIEKKGNNIEVSHAFAELAGKIDSFSNLSAIDWLVGVKEFSKGDIAAALNKNKERYVADPIEHLFPAVETDLTRYRDYLREIWLNRIVQLQSNTGAHFDRTSAIRQLNARFHQNFLTSDIREHPANELLIPIVIQILTTPKGNGEGYGILPGAIPAKGALTNRQYLDLLVGMSGISLTEFGLRFRIKLTRLDTEISNAVQENVYTLQDFFRDSFECGEEPFHVAPDILNQPMIPETMQGKGPFYLQYEEWLTLQQPFYPENFYDVRKAFPIGDEGAGLSKAELDKLNNYKAGATK